MGERDAHGRVASDLPGRVRIRLHPPHRHALPRVKAHLEAQAHIRAVETNGATGSVLVRYHRQRLSRADVLAMCRDVGVLVTDVVAPEAELLTALEGGATGGAAASLDDLGRRLSAAVGRPIDLELVFPLGIGALGLRQLLADGFGSLSGYLLLWLAYDIYRQLHRPRPATAIPGEVTEPRS